MAEVLVVGTAGVIKVISFSLLVGREKEKAVESSIEQKYSAPVFENMVGDALTEVFSDTKVIPLGRRVDAEIDFEIKGPHDIRFVIVKYYRKAISNLVFHRIIE